MRYKLDLKGSLFRDGILWQSEGKRMSVYRLCEEYIKIRTPLVRHNTAVNYRTSMRIIAMYSFGQMRIRDVTRAKARLFLSSLQNEEGYRYSTIQNLRGILRPAFEQAVEDELIRYNPFDFELKSVVKNDTVRGDALSSEELRTFLGYVRDSGVFGKYYDMFYLQFHTGLRVSELCGLTEQDLNFEEHYLNITRQLLRKGTMELYLGPPKSRAGVRKVPMTPDVEKCLRHILKNRPQHAEEFIVSSEDGTMHASGFLFYDRNGMPVVAQTVESHYRAAAAALREDIPNATKKAITSHVARHTYCSLRVKEGMQPVTLQKIMGHSSIRTTLGWYTHLTEREVVEETLKLMAGDPEVAAY